MSIDSDRALVAAVSACVHYQEFIDTGESFDLDSAKSAQRSPSLAKWMRKNPVLMPNRRDGKTQLESIE